MTLGRQDLCAPITLRAAQQLRNPIVYGLCDGDGAVFYVGQTRNPSKRFEAHRQMVTKNVALKRRLIELGDAVRMVVLKDNPADLSAAERAAIAAHQGQIVNLVGAGHWAWARHSSVPWAAGTGVLAPSAYALMVSPADNKGAVRDRLSAMSIPERCRFELALLADFPDMLRKRFAKWLAIAGPKISVALGESIDTNHGEIK